VLTNLRLSRLRLSLLTALEYSVQKNMRLIFIINFVHFIFFKTDFFKWEGRGG
jgi:hypothetical protein